ncbi:MAG: transcriptional repressor [Myxococcales bacterium]|nr:transcriptional repressor [Myxococcales bacterium]
MVDGLRGAGLKLTPQRLALVRELAGDASHPTAQELFERLRPALPTMSFATVYNTLAALSEARLCATRSLMRGPVRFDPKVEPHDHAVCGDCGRVTDVPIPSVPVRKDGERARRIEGFSVHHVERVYRGICADCRPK